MKYTDEINRNLKIKDRDLVKRIVTEYLTIIKRDLLSGKVIHLHGLLSLRKEMMPARTYSDPRTKEIFVKENYYKIKMKVLNSFLVELKKKKIYKGE